MGTGAGGDVAEEIYHLVFRGEVLEGQHAAVVCKRLAALLKMDVEKAKALFSGKPVVLKRDVPKATAAKFQGAFRKAGARLRVVPVDRAGKGAGKAPGKDAAPAKAEAPKPAAPEQVAPEPAAPKPAAPKPAAPKSAADAPAPAPADDGGAPKKMSLAERLAAEEAEQAEAAAATVGDPGAAPGRPGADLVPDDAPGASAFDLAPEGGDLVREDEITRPPPVSVDVSHLSAESASLEDVPQRPPPVPAPDTSAYSVDESGADLTEARTVPEPDLDLSSYSVADPGADLTDGERPPPPPAPDPDFSLAEPGADVGGLERPPAPPPPDVSHLKVESG